MAYIPSEGGSEYWPRAVIYDFYCDPSADVGTPRSVVEWPSYTYKGKEGRGDGVVRGLIWCVVLLQSGGPLHLPVLCSQPCCPVVCQPLMEPGM